MSLKVGALFAGYLGLEMGVASVLDTELAWVSEIDRGACKILAHRAPDVPNIGDVTAVDWSQVEPVDVITGGSPCQDLSHAGRRAGMTEGTRSNLWVAMREAIAVIRPSLVVWENVRGALSAPADSAVEPCPGCVGDGSGVHLRALGRVVGDLSSLGFNSARCGLRAADVGAPHGRWREFLLGWPAADAERGGLAGWAPEPLRREVRGTAAARGGEVSASMTLLPTPAVNDMGEGKTVEAWDEWTAKMQAKHGNGNGHGASLAIEAQRLLPTPTAQDQAQSGGSTPSNMTLTDAVVRTRMGTQPNDRLLPTPMVGSNTEAAHGQISGQYRAQMAEALTRWGQYAAAIERWERITRPAPGPTELGPKGSPRLSARFSEWLMGVPDGWITDVPGITRNEALKAAGNGVVPQQAAAALRWLLAVRVSVLDGRAVA